MGDNQNAMHLSFECILLLILIIFCFHSYQMMTPLTSFHSFNNFSLRLSVDYKVFWRRQRSFNKTDSWSEVFIGVPTCAWAKLGQYAVYKNFPILDQVLLLTIKWFDLYSYFLPVLNIPIKLPSVHMPSICRSRAINQEFFLGEYLWISLQVGFSLQVILHPVSWK
jgi:hypothetical protein